jgi:glycosyltransferase involved in cell wall biosynthesis
MQFPVPSETFASLDVEALRDQGHDVSVYGMRPKHSKYEDLIKERGHVGMKASHFSLGAFVSFLHFSLCHPFMVVSLLGWVIYCCARTPKHLLKSLILIPSAIAIFSSVYREKPDIVHLFWGHYPSMIGYLTKKYMPSTIVSLFLGAQDLVSAYPGSVQLSRNTDLIFTHSRSNLPMMGEMGYEVSKVNVILRGVKLAPLDDHALTKFTKVSSPIFLTAGRLIEEKGFDDVIYIFRDILEKHPTAILHIAGDGPHRSYLEGLAFSLGVGSNVVFIGHVCQAELKGYMSKAGFFLLMSRYLSERLPNVVKEAMDQRCIVVTTDTVGIDELIDHTVDGYIVNKGNIDLALTYLYRCLSDLESALDIADRAHQKIGDKFDVHMSMKSYLNLWQGIIDLNRPS